MDWEQEAVKAQENEKLAIQYGQMYQGKPWLHDAVDGGWQKQSHEHSYSSFPGKKLCTISVFIFTAPWCRGITLSLPAFKGC